MAPWQPLIYGFTRPIEPYVPTLIDRCVGEQTIIGIERSRFGDAMPCVSMACLFVPALSCPDTESSQKCRVGYADPMQIDFGQLPEIGRFLQGRARVRLLHPH